MEQQKRGRGRPRKNPAAVEVRAGVESQPVNGLAEAPEPAPMFLRPPEDGAAPRQEPPRQEPAPKPDPAPAPAPAPVEGPSALVTPAHVAAFFDAIHDQMARAIIRQAHLKGTPYAEGVQRILKLTPADERDTCPPIANLANRYLPATWGKYSDVGLCVLGVYRMESQKFSALKEFFAQIQADAAEAARMQAARPQ